MIKCIVFDLDGVLWNSREMHFEVLNEALKLCAPEYVITPDEHIRKFNGLTTRMKLKILSERGLNIDLHDKINSLKQELTQTWIENNVSHDDSLVTLMKDLSVKFSLGLASNSVRNTSQTFLKKTGIHHQFKTIISNEDVTHPKPSPEMYLLAMSHLNYGPSETLIIEDSPVGSTAAATSGAHVMHVSSPRDLSYDAIMDAIERAKLHTKQQRIITPALNIVIPMAGLGSRFMHEGYELPKPLIDVKGKPMIKVVIDALGLNACYTFIVRDRHVEKCNIDYMLKLMEPGCSVIQLDDLTEGAACTVLRASLIFNNQEPLMIVNSDQYIEWNYVEFMQKMYLKDADAGILTFTDTANKWSFAKLGDDGYVTEVAEKRPISDKATCGIYYWKHGSDFFKYANQMIDKNIRTNNEFYVCPVFNEAIQAGLKVITHDVNVMHGLGTPEDLEDFLK